MTMRAGTGMIYEGMLSLTLEAVAAIPSANQLVTINEANEVLLNNLLMLDEKFDNDDDDEIIQELRRQDMKLRLIMDLLSTLLLQNQLLPAASLVRFSGEELSVPAADLNHAAGSKLKCSLFIDPAVPKPLVLFAQVQGQHAEDAASDDLQATGTASWMDFTFVGLTRSLQDHIEKLIFRHHRKAVALQRRQNSNS